MSVDSSPPRQSKRPLFTVSNHHAPHCGAPPAVNGDEGGVYHGYFENSHGEQFVFLYRWNTGEAVVRCGDAGWEKLYPVTEGIARVTDPLGGRDRVVARVLEGRVSVPFSPPKRTFTLTATDCRTPQG